MKQLGEETYEFSTGRRLGVVRGVIGLGPDLMTYEGFDDRLEVLKSFTREERIELAEFMIMRWQLYYSFVKGT